MRRSVRRSISERPEDGGSRTNGIVRSVSDSRANPGESTKKSRAEASTPPPVPAAGRRRSWLFGKKAAEPAKPTSKSARKRSSTAQAEENEKHPHQQSGGAKPNRRGSAITLKKFQSMAEKQLEVDYDARNSRKMNNFRARNEWKQFIDEITETEHGYSADAELKIKCQGYLGKLNRESG